MSVTLATIITHPLDSLKVQRQTARGFSSASQVKIMQVRSLFRGLVPSAFRASVYGGFRLGMFQPFSKWLEGHIRQKKIAQLFAALSSGALAVLPGNPLDVYKESRFT